VKGVEVYKDVLKDAPDPQKPEDMGHGQKSLDDLMYEEECKKYELAWDQSAQYAVFYAYLKLKE